LVGVRPVPPPAWRLTKSLEARCKESGMDSQRGPAVRGDHHAADGNAETALEPVETSSGSPEGAHGIVELF
jgi:hypothetical protein